MCAFTGLMNQQITQYMGYVPFSWKIHVHEIVKLSKTPLLYQNYAML